MKILNTLLILIPFLSTQFRENAIISPLASNEDSLKIIEKVYLHIDRDRYSPDDDLWFKAYLIDASTGYLTDNSRNLHVELISPELNIIDSRIVRLNGGLGNGDFKIPKDIKSGQYRIRAYTNYMRNFSDSLFFNKAITIINISEPVKSQSESPLKAKSKLEIRFFPESGSLIENVLSNVGFKAIDEFGNGCEVSGNLYASSGELITAFKDTHRGMGMFPLKPLPGIRYYTIVKNSFGETIRTDLPESFPTGTVLILSKNNLNELQVIIRTNSVTLPLLTDREISLLISSKNKLLKKIQLILKSVNNSITIPTDEFRDGIISLTLSASDNIPLNERLVYIQNNESVKINLETNKPVYKQRDSVAVKISMSDNYGLAPETYLSLSAVENSSLNSQSVFPMTISSWFLLESDIRGNIEEPSYYFDPSNPDRLKDLDLLLLTQGWRDFEWKYKKEIFPAENGFTVSGSLRKILNETPIKNADITIGIFQEGKPFIGVVQSDSSGKFSLNNIDITGARNLVATISSEKEATRGWLTLDSTKYLPPIVKNVILKTVPSKVKNETAIQDSVVKSDLKTFIKYSEIKNTLQKKYKLSDTVSPGEVSIIARRTDAPESARAKSVRYLMGQPDKELLITPQIQKLYSNTRQFLISSNVITPRTGPVIPRGINSKHWMQYPIYMIDGSKVMKSDVEALPIRMIERIDILDNAASYQTFGYTTFITDSGTFKTDKPDGVISIILKSDWINDNSTVYHSAKMNLTGYNEPRIFYSPKHKTTLIDDFKPDLRTTLFWEPDITIQNNNEIIFRYFNADNSSLIKIVAEGITSTGIPVTGSAEYEVK
jgi:hypothetical protein